MKPLTLFNVMKNIDNLEENSFIIIDENEKEYKLNGIVRSPKYKNSIILKLKELEEK